MPHKGSNPSLLLRPHTRHSQLDLHATRLPHAARHTSTTHTCEPRLGQADTEAILAFRPERLGHALHLTPAHVATLEAAPIPIELCPTSNMKVLPTTTCLTTHPPTREYCSPTHPLTHSHTHFTYLPTHFTYLLTYFTYLLTHEVTHPLTRARDYSRTYQRTYLRTRIPSHLPHPACTDAAATQPRRAPHAAPLDRGRLPGLY